MATVDILLRTPGGPAAAGPSGGAPPGSSGGGAAGSSTATSGISGQSGWGYTGNNSRLAEPLRPSWIGEYPDLGCSDEYEIVCVAKPNL